MAPPNLAGQQFSGDGSPWNDNFPQVPDLGPAGLRTEAEDLKPLMAFGMHGALAILNEGREAEYDRLTALLTRVRTMKLSGPCNDSAPRSRRNCSRVLT